MAYRSLLFTWVVTISIDRHYCSDHSKKCPLGYLKVVDALTKMSAEVKWGQPVFIWFIKISVFECQNQITHSKGMWTQKVLVIILLYTDVSDRNSICKQNSPGYSPPIDKCLRQEKHVQTKWSWLSSSYRQLSQTGKACANKMVLATVLL